MQYSGYQNGNNMVYQINQPYQLDTMNQGISQQIQTLSLKNIYPNRYIVLYVNTTIEKQCLSQFNYCLVKKKLQSKIENLYSNSESIFIIFKNKQNQQFTGNQYIIGAGKMISMLDSLEFCPTNVLDQLMQQEKNFQPQNYCFFLVEWIVQQTVSFQNTQNIQNSYFPTHPIYTSKDGQELHQDAGIQLLNLLINQNFDNSKQEQIQNINSPESSISVQSPIQMNPMSTQDQKISFLQQQQTTLNPITLAYPPQQPFGLNNYLNEIPIKLFIYPLLLQNEKKGIWTKGAGGLAEFLLKKMKKEIEQTARSSSREKTDAKQIFKEEKRIKKGQKVEIAQ